MNNLITQPIATDNAIFELGWQQKATVLMGRESIIFVNTIFCSNLCEITSPISGGPWIPMIPDSEQGQDLSEGWQEEDDD